MHLNTESIRVVNKSTVFDNLVKPLYSSYNFSNIPGTIENILTGSTSLGSLPGDVLKSETSDTVILLFIDAFGWRFLEEVVFESSEFEIFRKEALVSKLTSMFPSTTSAHVPTIHTGLTPPQTKLFEWRQYNKELDDIITPLKGTLGYSKTKLNDLDISIENLYPQSTYYTSLSSKGVESYTVIDNDYAFSDFNKAATYGSHTISYKTLSEAFSVISNLINSKSSKKRFIHFYMNEVDEMAHKYGASSDFVKQEIEHTFKLINQYLTRCIVDRDDISLIIIADHGQDEFDPEETIYINKVFPELSKLIKKNKKGELILPSGSSKDIFLHVQQDQISYTHGELKKIIGDRCGVYLTSDLIEQQMFGNETYDDEFIQMLGDIIILPNDGQSAWWYRKEDKRKQSKGQHGGLSKVQAEIPFIMF